MPRMLLGLPGVRKRSAADMARLNEAKTKLYAGTLKPGELFEIVYGYPVIHPFDRMKQLQGQAQTGVLGAARSGRTQCKDCGKDLRHDGLKPLMSQPARCNPCGRRKRGEHNESYRGSLRAPEPEAEPVSVTGSVTTLDPRFA